MPLPSIDRSGQDASHFQCGVTDAPVSMGTSIIAVTYKGGVILGADSRTSTGTYIANRVADKITPLANNVYILRSGSAADTQALSSYVQLYIAQHQSEEGEEISVSTAARLATNIAYQNKDMLQAGLIIAGWDKHKGGTVWGIPLGGTMMQAPYATGGSGSSYIYGWMDKVLYSGDPFVIDREALKEYCGQAPFAKDRFYESTPAGVVMGLAWTSMGGATLYVEAAKVFESEAKGALTTTGQLGDVFRESASIAHTFARYFLSSIDPHNKFFSSSAIHIHVPAGATPKDGPSAGCTIATALLSLALGKPVTPDLAMTGEVTLTGRVLPIGGVKEKVLAARRSGVKMVIFPEANRHDYEELNAELKEGLSPHFVSHFDQIFKLALEYDGPLAKTPPPTPASGKDLGSAKSS